ncbi:MAG TPA: hypothetical protein VF665_20875, partial [Longimicrobium sp.]|uniref:hypothetical protein n=1 Tax=Longimicrobium sp. TaxID=2029185 RepID=UPI002ED8C40A
MKKLKLESLTVETFEPARTERATRGTVRGHDWSRLGHDETCGGMSCDTRASPCTTTPAPTSAPCRRRRAREGCPGPEYGEGRP